MLLVWRLLNQKIDELEEFPFLCKQKYTMRLFKRFAMLTIMVLSFICCAKRGSITGGPKDETPPQFVRSYPPNFSTNFKSEEIKIYFDELISLDKPDSQVIISPPMKNKPDITPLGGARKFVKIVFNDTLQPNTTYTINFGSSVVDYNEKNAFPFFQYVFSTGNELDSLGFKGKVVDAFKQKTEKNISAFLYEKNESFTDSTIFKTPPRYVASTLDSSLFEFKNLKAGTYQLIAIKDRNSNYLYDPKQDQIAFMEESITIPQDSVADLRLFKEALPFKISRAKQVSKFGFELGYFGKIDTANLNITPIVIDTLMEARYYKFPEKDTLKVFAKPFVEQDSLLFIVKNNTLNDTLISRYKNQYLDTLKIERANSKATLRLEEAIKLKANSPLTKVNVANILLIDKDSTVVDFTNKLDYFNNILSIEFNKNMENKYALTLLPEAIEDFLGQVNDTIKFNFKTGKIADFGNLALTISGATSTIIVELTKNDKVVYQKTITKEKSTVDFNSIAPGKYDIRLILDENNNGIWDTGSYFGKQQPEKTFFHPETINIRANWDVQQTIVIPQSVIESN